MELLNKKPTVLCILDEFTFNCFKPECEKLIPFNEKTWKKVLSEIKFDFFLCESVWKPIGSNFKLGSRDKKTRSSLYKNLSFVISFIRTLGIPTVFWNKEDNKHYQHYKLFAGLFDHIFTTDIRTIPSYKKECPYSKSINTLLFAAQPILHNPIKVGNNKFDGDVLFAGGWYNFPERVRELEEMLQLPGSIKLHIYERGFNGKNSKFPYKFRNRIRKGIGYLEMSNKYKKYPIMLNVNSVKGSLTMFSRRVPEALLCGVTVISSPSMSLKQLFPHVFFKQNKQELFLLITQLLKNSEFRCEHNHNARREILLKHLYFNRMVQICKVINIKPPEFKTGVVNLYLTSNSAVQNNFLLKDIKKQQYENIVGNIEVTNSPVVLDVLKNLFYKRQLPNGEIVSSLGFVCFFHPKSRYEPNYIIDSLLSYHYFQDIDIIGKACIYSWENEKANLLYEELEHCYTEHVHPHTITISLAGDLKKREQKLNYLRNILGDTTVPKEDLKIYSSDRYNFIFVK